MPEPTLAAVTGRLAWGRDGSCWAFTTVPALPYNPAAPSQQEEALSRLLAVGASLPGEFAAWGLCQPWPDHELAAHMLAAHRGERWARQVEATMAALPELETRFRRVYYLAVRLDGVRHRASLRVDARAAVPPPATITAGLERAAIVDRRLAQLGGRPSTAEEIAWIVERVVTRGCADLPLRRCRDVLCGDALAGLADCEIVNSGPYETVDADGRVVTVRPVLGRWVRVVCHDGPGFQTVVAVEQVPAPPGSKDEPGGFDAPGGPGEWLARVERLNLPVDWFVAGTIEPNAKAQKAVRFKKRQIQGEGNDTSHDMAGIRPALVDAWQALDAQEQELSSTGQNGLMFTSLFTVGATTVEELEQRVAVIEDLFAADDYQLTRRLGRQKGLLLAQLPCHRFVRTSPLWRFRQYSGPSGWAAAAPFCGSVGGDPTGLLFAVDAGTGVRTPLFWQAGYAASINQSPSIIVGGELGGGKSFAAKELVCEGLIPAGGQAFTFDFTQSQETADGTRVGEWVHLASVLDCTTAVIDVDRGDESLDPLSMVHGAEPGLPLGVAEKMLKAALVVACNYADDSRQSDLLGLAVANVAADPTKRAADVIDWLADYHSVDDPMAVMVAREVRDRLLNTVPYMPAVFERHRTAPNLDAQFVVFAATALKLPTWAELNNRELAVKVTRDKRAGQALLTLCADLAIHRCKATSAPTLVVMDESWRVTASTRGQEIVNELVTEGRRYNAGLLAIIQNVGRLTDDVRSFAGMVLIFRCRGEAAQAAADLIGVDVAHVAGLRDIRDADGSPASGFCYMRDVRGRLVLAHVLPPKTAALAAAVETTPTLEEVA